MGCYSSSSPPSRSAPGSSSPGGRSRDRDADHLHRGAGARSRVRRRRGGPSARRRDARQEPERAHPSPTPPERPLLGARQAPGAAEGEKVVITKVVKQFTQTTREGDVDFRIVEVSHLEEGHHIQDKYVLEYCGRDLVGDRQWRTMCATAVALLDGDPLA